MADPYTEAYNAAFAEGAAHARADAPLKLRFAHNGGWNTPCPKTLAAMGSVSLIYVLKNDLAKMRLAGEAEEIVGV